MVVEEQVALNGSVMLGNPAGALHLGRPTYTRGAHTPSSAPSQ